MEVGATEFVAIKTELGRQLAPLDRSTIALAHEKICVPASNAEVKVLKRSIVDVEQTVVIS